MVATVQGTIVSVKQRHGRREMDDIIVILCKVCALNRKRHIDLYYIVTIDKII